MVADSRSIGMIDLIPGASCGYYRRKYRDVVPIKRAKPSLERWSQEPRVGKIRAARH